MHRLLLGIVLGTATFGTVVAGADAPLVVEGSSKGQADTSLAVDMQAQETMDEATAAALIGALTSRFEGRDFELRLGDTRSERVSLRDIALDGEAKIRFADADRWLPLRYQALYDTSGMVVESPHITLGAERSADSLDASKLPLHKLQAALGASMDAEYQSNSVDVALQQARIVDDDGTRYIVQATGNAVFDDNDEVPLIVHALYDRKTGRWLDPQYDLDESGGALAAR